MKKKTARLTLHRETVRTLAHLESAAAMGAEEATGYSICWGRCITYTCGASCTGFTVCYGRCVTYTCTIA